MEVCRLVEEAEAEVYTVVIILAIVLIVTIQWLIQLWLPQASVGKGGWIC
jgi:hypothetical protein